MATAPVKIGLKALVALKQAVFDAETLVSKTFPYQATAATAVQFDLNQMKLNSAIAAYNAGLKNYDPTLP